MNYGDNLPDLKGRPVYIVDFSFPAKVMGDIKSQAKEVLWFDHHATSVEIQKELGWGLVDLSECGSTLTWRELFPGEDPPPILGYIKDKDLWQWKLEGSRAVSEALADLFRGNFFEKLLEVDPRSLIKQGEGLMLRKKERVDEIVNRGFETILDSHRAYAANCHGDTSDVGERINKDLGFPVAVMFHHNGKKWVHALRSTAVDVSKIAQKFGGGGHPQAAGFMAAEIAVKMPEARNSGNRQEAKMPNDRRTAGDIKGGKSKT